MNDRFLVFFSLNLLVVGNNSLINNVYAFTHVSLVYLALFGYSLMIKILRNSIRSMKPLRMIFFI